MRVKGTSFQGWLCGARAPEGVGTGAKEPRGQGSRPSPLNTFITKGKRLCVCVCVRAREDDV